MKIYKLDELEGSCYIEVLPGPYRDRCWNEDSIYMDEETFGYLESAVKKNTNRTATMLSMKWMQKYGCGS